MEATNATIATSFRNQVEPFTTVLLNNGHLAHISAIGLEPNGGTIYEGVVVWGVNSTSGQRVNIQIDWSIERIGLLPTENGLTSVVVPIIIS